MEISLKLEDVRSKAIMVKVYGAVKDSFSQYLIPQTGPSPLEGKFAQALLFLLTEYLDELPHSTPSDLLTLAQTLLSQSPPWSESLKLSLVNFLTKCALRSANP